MSRILAISSVMALASLSCGQEAPAVDPGQGTASSSTGSTGNETNASSSGVTGGGVSTSTGIADTTTGIGATGGLGSSVGSTGPDTGGSSTTTDTGTNGSTATASGSGSSGLDAGTDEDASATAGGNTGGTTGSMTGSTTGGGTTGRTTGGTTAATTGGGTGGATGGTDSSVIMPALNALRIDDTCASQPASGTTTCNHVSLQGSMYHDSKSVTIGGTPGTIYNVTIKIRGVVEPTIINGGSKPDATNAPQLNLGGTPGDPTYQPWFLSVSSPSATYYLNNFGFTNHTIHMISWQETIPMAAGSTVTLDVRDGNDHEICNTQGAGGPFTITGIPASKNSGQFVQIDGVAATPK